MRTLTVINEDFQNIKKNNVLNQHQKNIRYVRLMEELEQDHKALILNPDNNETVLPQIALYRLISEARIF